MYESSKVKQLAFNQLNLLFTLLGSISSCLDPRLVQDVPMCETIH